MHLPLGYGPIAIYRKHRQQRASHSYDNHDDILSPRQHPLNVLSEESIPQPKTLHQNRRPYGTMTCSFFFLSQASTDQPLNHTVASIAMTIAA
jgi:hypothetical protein